MIVTGHLALGFRIPLLTLATFGGGAQLVWNAIVPDNLPTESERDVMAAPTWTAASADLCFACLEDQRTRRQREQAGQNSQANVEKREKRLRYVLTLGLMIGSMGVLTSAFLLGAESLFLFLALMFLGPCVSGAAGSVTRAVWTEEGAPVQLCGPWFSALPTALIVLAVITGWIAGFTFDLVFTKLAKTEVTRTKVIA